MDVLRGSMCRTWYCDFAMMEPLFCVELCCDHLIMLGYVGAVNLIMLGYVLNFCCVFFFNLASWVLCRNFGA